jgi:autotransporter-associated beta strand protein
MWGAMRGLLVATALLAPSTGLAQVQVNQIFSLQGPSPSIGPAVVVQSGDIPGQSTYGSVAGAVQAVVTDPLDVNTIYTGTPGGGIWRTTNGGTTWTPLTDKQATLSIYSLSLDPTDPSRKTLIAGTGVSSNGTIGALSSSFQQFSSSGGIQNGLLYSQDGGNTWTTLGSATLANQNVSAVLARGPNILAATSVMSEFGYGAPSTTNSGALYQCTIGASTCTLVSGAAGSRLPQGPVTALVGDPSNPSTLYAAVSSRDAASNANTAIYMSIDSGTKWMKVFDATNSKNFSGTTTITSASQTMIKLATGPNGAVAAGVVDLSTNTVTGLFWSNNPSTSAGSWTALKTPAANNLNYITQAPWNFTIAIDPTNSNLVYVAGDETQTDQTTYSVPAYRIDVAKQTITSLTLDRTANNSFAHSDARAIAFDAAGRLILTSDGSIYLRTSPTTSAGDWQRINGNLSAVESYSVAYDGLNKRLAVAAQDNGVALQSSPAGTQWNAQIGADGLKVLINDRVTDPTLGRLSVMYFNTDSLGFINRIVFDANGNPISPNTASFGSGVPVSCSNNPPNGGCAASNSNFYSQMVLNKADPTKIAIAPDHVFVTQDTLTGAQGPSATSVNLTLRDLGSTGSGSLVTALAYGTTNSPNVLLAGVAPNGQGGGGAGQLWISTDTTKSSSLVQLSAYAALNAFSPTSLVFDPNSPSIQSSPGQLRFYVADSSNLWGTQNQGTSFQMLTGNLPANFIRPISLEFISNNGVNALLVGGLNSTADAQSPIVVADSDTNGNLSGWRPMGQGLPNTQISALSYNAAVDVLAVGTYGRGVAVLYDVTSYFPQALALQFGLANNDSQPDALFLTDGTNLNGTSFSRPLNKYGTGMLTIAGAASYTGGTTIFGGTLQLGNGGASGSILGDVAFCSDGTNPLCDPGTNKFLAFNRSDTYSFDGAISGPGQVQQIGAGTTILTANNSYTGGTTVSAGTLQVTNNNSVGTGAVTLDGGIFQAGADSLNFSNPFNVNTTGGAIDTNGKTLTLAGVIADGNGPGALVKIGAGTLMLTAANSYTGPTFVSGGTLSVNGSIPSSVFVGPGGTLGGNGTVGPTAILAGGTLSPGNSVGTLTVNGNLVFAAASLYMVEVKGSSADRTNVTGTASLAGTVALSYLGDKFARKYTILSAAGGLSGTFGSVVSVNLPAFITASLAYTPTDVQLNLTSDIRRIPGLTRNHAGVAAALDNAFNSGAGSPLNASNSGVGSPLNASNSGAGSPLNASNSGGSLLGLYTLAPSQFPAALDMLSGEGVSGTQETAFGTVGMFNSIMMDQGAFWRNRETIDVNGVTFAGEPLAYADAKKSKTSEHPAFKAMLTKEPPVQEPPRWRAWLTGFDGTWKLNGEADVGSASLSHNTGGLAGGLDYQFAPDLLAGFAIGGSSSNFSVRDRITSGNLEGAHFGGYGVKTWGPLYAAGALSFSTFRNSETRTIAGIGPTETATGSFGSNLLSGRLEMGWKQAFNWFSVTPFAAVQAAQLWENGFTETNPVPAGATDQLGLAYGSKRVASLPTFLGAQFDTRLAVWNGMALSPYARLSWVHEFKPDRAIDASFIALPATGFTVDGPRAARDAARIDAGAKLAIHPNAWLFASFDGEFSSRSQSYAGKGGAKVTW